tara:strand:+ start:2845 stop:4206 length:1362 start_codon:yes stop_codon:yes gene_type:complete
MAAEALALGRQDWTGPVLEKAQLCLSDAFSGAFEAAPLAHSQQAASIAEPGESALIATGRGASHGDAAFANAVAAHGLVREDMHTGSVAHFGVVVWPALLAASALRSGPVTGHAFLTAGAIAYEVGARTGKALMTPQLARMFRPTGLCGPLAAATGAGLLLGLDEQALASAMAFAINTAAGLNEWPHAGGADMFFHAGFAAQNGLRAARLAQAGAFGSPSVLEGAAGLFRAIGRTEAPASIPLAKAPDEFEILSVFHKAVPACNYAQTPGQAALAALAKFPAAPGKITSVRVDTTDAALAYPGCARSGPFRNALQAKMSIRFAVAAALLRGEISEACYADPADPDITALIPKIDLVADSGFTAAYPARQGARVTIRSDETETTAELEDVQVAGPDEIRARLARHATIVLGDHRAAQFLSLLDTAVTAPDIRDLNALCRRDDTQSSKRSTRNGT